MATIEGVRDYTKEALGQYDALASALIPLIRTHLEDNGRPESTKVVDYVSPPDLDKLFDFSLPDEGSSVDELVTAVQQFLKYSVRTGHPRYFNQLYAASDPIGYFASFLLGVINTNNYTFAVGPVMTMLEVKMMRRFGEVFGWPAETTDGILVPGGSYANLMAMLAARHWKFPEIRAKGYQGQQLVAFVSAQAHYSGHRSAMMLGLGMDNCVRVACLEDGRMDAADLDARVRAALEAGHKPFFVQATQGTTVLGVYDDLVAIRKVCDAHGLWLHADAAWGGNVAFSEKHRHLLAGVEGADSLTICAHKAMGVPVLCSAILVNNHEHALAKSNASGAEYLFHPGEGREFDIGDKTLQCGRDSLVVKLWMAWKFHGPKGFGERCDRAFANTARLHELLLAEPDRFEVVRPPTSCNLTWWYIPEAWRGKTAAQIGKATVDRITQTIYARMQRAGSMLVNHSPLSDLDIPRFFRMILVHPQVTEADLEFVVAEMDRLGADLTPETLLE